MKTDLRETIVVDEAQQRTYVVRADLTLMDGELCCAIRLKLLRRGRPLARGERPVISIANLAKTKGSAESPAAVRVRQQGQRKPTGRGR